MSYMNATIPVDRPIPVKSMVGTVMRLEVVLPVLLLFVFVANLLRFKRADQKHQEFKYPDRESMAKMTMEDAQKIQLYLFRYEFPFTAEKALQFALFR